MSFLLCTIIQQYGSCVSNFTNLKLSTYYHHWDLGNCDQHVWLTQYVQCAVYGTKVLTLSADGAVPVDGLQYRTYGIGGSTCRR